MHFLKIFAPPASISYTKTMGVYFFLGLLTGLIIGIAAGAAGMWWLGRRQQQALKDSFAALAAEQLEKNTRQLLDLAQEKLGQHVASSTLQQGQEMESKKALIDQNLTTIKAEIGKKLETVTALMQSLEKDRETKFSMLAQQISQTGEHLSKLQLTTSDLTAALANSRTRGQWGERMAEDVLQLAGMKENINYRKQGTLTGSEGERRRPDFTFLLPDSRVIHMDVKFPMDGYLRWHKAEDETSRNDAARRFVAATRQHIRSTSAREYRSALTQKNEAALDYILIFIPNEQIYAFLLEQSPEVLNEALGQKVILCSPTTLLAVLAVVHQAMQSFTLNQQAQQVYTLLAGIQEQWGKFTEHMAKIGEKLHEAQKAFDTVTTTRRNQLDRQFAKLDNIGKPASPPQPSTLLDTTSPPDERVN